MHFNSEYAPFQRFKQTTEWNCAAGAVAFFVHVQSGKELDVDEVTRKLGSTEADGTTHGAVYGYLDFLYRYDGFKIVATHELGLHRVELPLIVNYMEGDDGHYGVLTELLLYTKFPECSIFDPWTGNIEPRNWDDFKKKWVSPRYGRNWGLYLTKTQSDGKKEVH